MVAHFGKISLPLGMEGGFLFYHDCRADRIKGGMEVYM